MSFFSFCTLLQSEQMSWVEKKCVREIHSLGVNISSKYCKTIEYSFSLTETVNMLLSKRIQWMGHGVNPIMHLGLLDFQYCYPRTVQISKPLLHSLSPGKYRCMGHTQSSSMFRVNKYFLWRKYSMINCHHIKAVPLEFQII